MGERKWERYQVVLCATCAHPGGQHLLSGGCWLCGCQDWIAGAKGPWSDKRTKELRAARLSGNSGAEERSDG